MKILALVHSLILAFLFNSVAVLAYGPEITNKTLDLPEFHSVYVNSAYTVYIKQSNKQEVSVEALTEIFEISEFKVENGVLHVNIKRKKDEKNKSLWGKLDDIKISPTLNLRISIKRINELRVNGKGRIIGENSLASNQLKLGMSGPGSMELDLKSTRVITDISGAGNIKLTGYANDNTISLSGAGTLSAFEFELVKATVSLTGSGECEIHVTDNLEANLYGSGSIKHKGSTKNVMKKEYGSGEVARAY